MTTAPTPIETLRFGVANLEARVADAKARAEANPTMSIYWTQLDRDQWALADMREALANEQRRQAVTA